MTITVQIIPVGKIDPQLRKYYNWNSEALEIRINSLSDTLLEIRVGSRRDRRIFRFQSCNANGEEISINRCVLNGNHLVATMIALSEDNILKDKFQNEFSYEDLKKTMGSEVIYGKMHFLEQTDLTDKGDIVKRLWERYKKKLTNQEKDFLKMEEDYDERYENLRTNFKKTTSDLQNTIIDLQNTNVAQLVLLTQNIIEIIHSQVMDHMLQSNLIKKDLKDKLRQLTNQVSILSKNKEKLEDKSDESVQEN